ncbi:hypothetical protein CAPTEDRAFT_156305 [Capitella teleta]|uniref:Uncharacterized protein n=1 Tax=Capitella teleta TaxID=283909 RepID=R7TBL6_CAPTE|nr:hypothetical protein CAPTEDRAFT_156305 [Capitella teleta]|eukprot:ELT88491.1 hypothetical protein CAPTEDRAFT_156305 [Capitella teleta]
MSSLSAFLTTFKPSRNTSVFAGQSLGVETCWVLALSFKALLKSLRSSASILKSSNDEDREAVTEALYVKEFVQWVVYLATQGTGFSKQWLLKDLEVLSLMLYARERENCTEETEAAAKEKPAVAAEQKDLPPQPPQGPLDGLDETAKLCFTTVNEHFGVPLPMLRAIYDTHGRNTNALLVAVHENIEGTSFTPSEKFSKIAAECVPRGRLILSVETDGAECRFRVLDEEAVLEPSDDSQTLISSVNSDLRSSNVRHRKSKSAHLLKRELEAQGRTGSRDYLQKVNTALSVMFARQVLAALLADWPSSGGHVIQAEVIGCKEQSHVLIVLDLLNRNESKETFERVVQNVVRHCEPKEVVPIALTSCQFMQEVSLSTIVRESDHNYKNNTDFTDKVHIPGATSLLIKFDNRCCTEDACDIIVMSSSADFKHDKHTFSGSKENWCDFELPGDTLFYKFESDGSENDWGYRFSVTGGRMGRFDTGYMVLNAILCLPAISSLLPINELWSSLVYVACKQTGQQRLKAVQLLLRLMQLQGSCERQTVDLSELSALWHLYTSLSASSSGGSSMVCPVVRALTELFFVAENLALEWGIAEEYASSLKHKDEFLMATWQGLKVVAAVSKAIGISNKATEGFDAVIGGRNQQVQLQKAPPLDFINIKI